ncbi:MAG: hypothetical protein AAGC56_13410 [Pseudomonadota bacterium]
MSSMNGRTKRSGAILAFVGLMGVLAASGLIFVDVRTNGPPASFKVFFQEWGAFLIVFSSLFIVGAVLRATAGGR